MLRGHDKPGLVQRCYRHNQPGPGVPKSARYGPSMSASSSCCAPGFPQPQPRHTTSEVRAGGRPCPDGGAWPPPVWPPRGRQSPEPAAATAHGSCGPSTWAACTPSTSTAGSC